MKSKIKFNIITKAIFLILIVVTASIYTAYLFRVSSNNYLNLNLENKDKKENSKFLDFLKKFNIGILDVYAQGKVCCEKTKQDSQYQGEACIFTEPENCDTRFQTSTTSCEQTTFCQAGCCFNTNTGICSTNTERAVCLNSGGSFDGNANCEIPQCEIGGCILPTGCSLTTRVQCNRAAQSFPDLEDFFKPEIKDEITLNQVCKSSEIGCCVTEGDALFITRSNCQGEFHANTYCSNDALTTSCLKQSTTNCLTEEQQAFFKDTDNVYWFDSCGNPENVYGTEYTGFVEEDPRTLPRCNKDDANIGKNCGFCDFTKGSICGEGRPQGENNPDVVNQCININCNNAATYNWGTDKSRRHGDSWCLYEGVTGQGRDLVGSRHYRVSCINGEEIIEACQGETSAEKGRQQICVQGNDLEGRPAATCVDNTAASCIGVNGLETLGGTCDNPDLGECSNNARFCRLLQDIKKDSEFRECCEARCARKEVCNSDEINCNWNENVDLCQPSVPLGGTSAKDINGNNIDLCFGDLEFRTILATGTATLPGAKGWEYKLGTQDFITGDFQSNWNNFCVAQGDCGAYYNILGKSSDIGFSYKGPSDPTDDLKDEDLSEDGNVDKETRGNDGIGIYPQDFILASLNNTITQPIKGKGFIFEQFILGLHLSRAGISGKEINFEEIINNFKSSAWDSIPKSLLTSVFIVLTSIAIASLFSSATILGATTFGLLGGLAALGPVGWIVAIILAIIFVILTFIFKTKAGTLAYTATCSAWTPPLNDNDCSRCTSETDFKFTADKCTEYRCKSLGACTFKDEDKDGIGTCVSACTGDTTRTVREGLLIEEDLQIINDPQGASRGYTLVDPKNNNKIRPNTPITLGVKTNEDALCRISKIRTKTFDEMVNFDNTDFTKEHEVKLEISNADTGPNSIDIFGSGQFTYYVRCTDACGNKNEDEFYIKFDVEAGPDITTPTIELFDPINNAKLQASSTETKVTLFVDEEVPTNGGCKYSRQDKNYEDMENNFTCFSSRVQTGEGRLFPCESKLSGLTKGDNAFYFRCSDLAGNVNRESQPKEGYHLFSTIPLVITESGPSGTIFTSEVNLTVKTAEGANEDGSSTCFSSKTNFFAVDSLVFTETGSNQHIQQLFLFPGTYKYYVGCRDIAGNEDTAEIQFTVDVDDDAPRISKIFTDSTFLSIITDENSFCRYHLEDKNFIWSEGIVMPDDNTKEHKAALGSEFFYVRCRDVFDNEMTTVKIYP